MDTLKKLMMKKQKDGKMLSDNEKDAKMSVLKDLHDSMSRHMGDKLHGMKKVTVASDSDEGLQAGLDKAKALSGHIPAPHDESQEDPMEEAAETPEDEAAEMAGEHGGIRGSNDTAAPHMGSEHDDMSEEEIDAKLAHLAALKHKKRNK